MRTLQAAMSALQTTHIDVLKIDVNGSEWEVLQVCSLHNPHRVPSDI